MVQQKIDIGDAMLAINDETTKYEWLCDAAEVPTSLGEIEERTGINYVVFIFENFGQKFVWKWVVTDTVTTAGKNNFRGG